MEIPDHVIYLPSDQYERPWMTYIGTTGYSAHAQVVMDICAGCLSDERRIPTRAEIRRISGLSSEELATAGDNLRRMGCEQYAAIVSVVPKSAKVSKVSKVSKPRVKRGRTIKARIPSELRWAVWERDDFTCQHCGTRSRLSVDHIYPESAGGPTTVDNCQTLCRSCNSSKGNRILFSREDGE